MRQWLKEKRLERGLTQEQLAKLIGISRSFYTQIESQGGNKGVSPKTAMKIAEELNISWTAFFEE